MKSFFCMIAVLGAASASAAPSVSVTSLSQDASRTVKVGYTLAGAPAIVTFDVHTNRGDGVWKSVGGANLRRVTGDACKVVEAAAGQIDWTCDHGDMAEAFAAGELKVVLKAWSLDNPPDYMAVDLTTGVSDGYERLRFYENADTVPGGVVGNRDYRVSVLLMRRCHAANVTWPMGSSSVRAERSDNEKQHMVTLDADYYLGVFPVTLSQSALLLNSNSMYPLDRTVRIRDILYYIGGGNPVRDTNWPEAPAETSMLGKLRRLADGKIDFDLPSEAQWEFACHAGNYGGYWGNGTPYLVNGTEKNVDANLPGRYRFNQATDWMPAYKPEYSTLAASIGVTNAVPEAGSYAPNDWGFYDMHGGVWEWCLDWYQDDITALGGAVNVSLEDPAKCADGVSGDGATRVVRGGSWHSSANNCRCETRYGRNQSYAGDFGETGARICAPARIR